MATIQTAKMTTRVIRIIIQVTKINTLKIKVKMNQRVKDKKRINNKI